MKKSKFLVIAFGLVLGLGSAFAQNTMLYVKGGTFQMGSEDSADKDAPLHTVTVSDFYITQTKVTINDWMNEIGAYPDGYEEKYYGRRVPRAQWTTTAVANVNWYDALIFCNRRSVDEGLTPCYASNGSKDAITNSQYFRTEFPNVTCDWSANGYRLPTEAEWEYAARNEKRVKDFQKGNSEWCWDWYSSSYYQASKNAKDPHGPDYGESIFSSGGQYGGYIMCRVHRGGVNSEGRVIRIDQRRWLAPVEYEGLVGPEPLSFRVVRNGK